MAIEAALTGSLRGWGWWSALGMWLMEWSEMVCSNEQRSEGGKRMNHSKSTGQESFRQKQREYKNLVKYRWLSGEQRVANWLSLAGQGISSQQRRLLQDQKWNSGHIHRSHPLEQGKVVILSLRELFLGKEDTHRYTWTHAHTCPHSNKTDKHNSEINTGLDTRGRLGLGGWICWNFWSLGFVTEPPTSFQLAC